MMRGMYAAISGLEAHQTMLDVTANNLANVDTVAYKAQRTEFGDELSQLVRTQPVERRVPRKKCVQLLHVKRCNCVRITPGTCTGHVGA